MNLVTPTIVYMDDDPDDIAMLEEAINNLDKGYTLMDAENGEKGLRLLSDLHKSGSLPCLIVLDINMPRMNGRETFQHLKKDETLSQIPVVVFSTSDSHADRAFFKGDKVEYMTKPVAYRQLLEVAKRLLDYCEN